MQKRYISISIELIFCIEFLIINKRAETSDSGADSVREQVFNGERSTDESAEELNITETD